VAVPQNDFAMIGIVGGMGPAAGNDTAVKLVAYAQQSKGATRDQEVPPYMLSSFSANIPDRTGFLLKNVVTQDGPEAQARALLAPLPGNPHPGMQQSVDALTAEGARVVVMPCNTAHAWFDTLKVAPGIKKVHIVDALIAALDKNPALSELPVKRIGLMATSGTINCGVYQARLEKLKRSDIEFVFPDAAVQDEQVMGGIYGLPGDAVPGGVKGGSMEQGRARLLAAGRHLIHDKRVDALSYSCTEVPLAINEREPDFGDVPGIDATKAMVEQAVDTAQQLVTGDRAQLAAASAAMEQFYRKPVTTLNNPVRPFGMP
jgi:aspartate racemase